MSKRVLIVTGSPRRNGNTNTLARWVAESLRDEGAEVEVVDAVALHPKVAGCSACMSCQRSPGFACVLGDDVAELVGRMPGYDVVVYASPIYFMGFSAQVKIVLDRMHCLIKFDPDTGAFTDGMPNTRTAWILTAGGDGGEGLDTTLDAIRILEHVFDKPAPCFTLPLAPVAAGALAERDDVRERAAAFARSLLVPELRAK